MVLRLVGRRWKRRGMHGTRSARLAAKCARHTLEQLEDRRLLAISSIDPALTGWEPPSDWISSPAPTIPDRPSPPAAPSAPVAAMPQAASGADPVYTKTYYPDGSFATVTADYYNPDGTVWKTITWNLAPDGAFTSITAHDSYGYGSMADYAWEYNAGELVSISQDTVDSYSSWTYRWSYHPNGMPESVSAIVSYDYGDYGDSTSSSWAYDTDGILLSVSEHYNDGGGTSQDYSWTYYPNGTPSSIIQDYDGPFYSNSSIWNYAADGGSTSVQQTNNNLVDGSSEIYDWTYDADGSLSLITETSTNPVGSLAFTATWVYSQGLLNSFTRHANNPDGSSSDHEWRNNADGSLEADYWIYGADALLDYFSHTRENPDGSKIVDTWDFNSQASYGGWYGGVPFFTEVSYSVNSTLTGGYQWSYASGLFDTTIGEVVLTQFNDNSEIGVGGFSPQYIWRYSTEDVGTLLWPSYGQPILPVAVDNVFAWDYVGDGSQAVYSQSAWGIDGGVLTGFTLYGPSYSWVTPGAILNNWPEMWGLPATGPPPPAPVPPAFMFAALAPTIPVPNSSAVTSTPAIDRDSPYTAPSPPGAPTPTPAPTAPAAPHLVLQPHISAVGNSDPAHPDKFYWDTVENGGGFGFTYFVDNPLELPLPATSIEFRWSLGPTPNQAITDPMYILIINSSTPDLQTPGEHKIHVKNAEIAAALRNAPLLGDGSPVPYLVMEVDPGRELDPATDDEVLPLKVVPLVVNVVTHGFNPNPLALIPGYTDSGFIETFDQLGDALRDIPEAWSTLYHRVSSYMPQWQSTRSFLSGFGYLLLSRIFYARSEVDVLDGNLPKAAVDLAGGILFGRWAAATADVSDRYGSLAALNTVRDILDPSANLIAAPDESNRLQRIELTGHSRGANVNATVALLLQQAGYRNIDYFALDGYGADWLDGSGVLSNWNIATATRHLKGEKINYRAQSGLAADPAVTPILSVLDPRVVAVLLGPVNDNLRAPVRAGFSMSPDIPGTTHTTISETYLSHLTDPAYLRELYVGRNRSAGLVLPSAASGELPQPSLAAAVDSTWFDSFSVAAESEATSLSSANILGFIDGDIEQLGLLVEETLAAGLALTGDPFLDEALQTITDPSTAIQLYWDITGDVRLSHTPADTALELHHSTLEQTSISQLVLLPQHADALEFDLDAAGALPGDVLEVLVDGTVLSTIELSSVGPTSRQSLPLGEITSPSATLMFRLGGPAESTAVVTLDNFTIVSGNHAPELYQYGPTFPTILATIADEQNLGVDVANLSWGINDQDFDAPGIALTATDATHGTVEYSLDGGDTWFDVGAVSDSNALLLVANGLTRVRFNPADEFTGEIGSVITFHAWDTTTGLAGLSGDYFDATDSGGSSAFSATSDSASIRIVDILPAVAEVRVSNSHWTDDFLAHLETAGLGSGGYTIPTGSPAQLAPLPWSGIDQVSITFNEPVNVEQWTMWLTGDSGAYYDVAAFQYDPGTYQATWTLSQPIRADHVNLTLYAWGVLDQAGNPLSGQWSDGASAYPSGNGEAGRDFKFAINVLPGDADQSGDVGIDDYTQWADHYLASGLLFGDGDFTGDGRVDGSDYTIWADNYLRSLGVVEATALGLAAAANPVAAQPLGGARVAAAAVVSESDQPRARLSPDDDAREHLLSTVTAEGRLSRLDLSFLAAPLARHEPTSRPVVDSVSRQQLGWAAAVDLLATAYERTPDWWLDTADHVAGLRSHVKRLARR